MRRIAWLTMAAAALAVSLFSLRYFRLDPALFLASQRAAYVANLGVLLLHVGGGTGALSLGPLQLLGRLRQRRPGLHRILGRAYLAAALAAGLGGLGLARIAEGGPLARLGFAGGALALLFTTAAGFMSIRRRRVAAHRAWMARSYALAFGAVTFRLWLAVFLPMQLPFAEVYAVGVWTTFLGNLLAAEVLMSSALPARRAPGRHDEGPAQAPVSA